MSIADEDRMLSMADAERTGSGNDRSESVEPRTGENGSWYGWRGRCGDTCCGDACCGSGRA